MKAFSKNKSKHTFSVHVLHVQPWTVGAGSRVAVAWRRGSRRGGAEGVGAPVGRDGLDIGARFEVPATLYRDPTGAHEKKWLSIELVRPGKPPVPLARGVVDLASLAARAAAAADGAPVCATLPLAAACGDAPAAARLTIEVTVSGGGARGSSGGGEARGATGTEAAAVAAARAAALGKDEPPPPPPPPPPVRRPVTPPPPASDASSDDGALLAAAAAAADAADGRGGGALAASPARPAAAAAAASPARTTAGSELWASMNSDAIAAAAASAMASDAGSPPRGWGEAAAPSGANPFVSADSEPGGHEEAPAPAAVNPFLDAEPAPPAPPPRPPPSTTTCPPPPVPPAAPPPRPLPTAVVGGGHARTPSNDLYLDGVALPGETGFGSTTPAAARPRSAGRAPAPDPIGDALEAAPPLDAIDLDPDAHDAAVGEGGRADEPPPPLPRRAPPPALPPPSLPRALLDETGAAIAANRRFARRAAGALRAAPPGAADADGAASPPSPHSPAAAAARARAALAARSRFSSSDAAGGGDGGEEAAAAPPSASAGGLEGELLSTAALEACVYLALPGDPARPSTTHAPARRLARTVVALGPGAGAEFGARALAAVAAAARAGGGGVAAAVRWWSTALQLRWMLWAMRGGGGGGGGGEAGGGDEEDEFGWAASALARPLRELEAALVDRALALLWAALVAAAAAAEPGEGGGGGGGGDAAGDDDGGAARAAERAAARWLEALRAARAALDATVGHAPPGHVALFRAVALGGLLARLDAAWLGALEGGGGSAGARAAADPLAPALPPSTLPFDPAAPLTFATGVALKLAASRLAHWASDAGVRDGAAPLAAPPRSPRPGAPDGGSPTSPLSPPLFPRVRAAADLLMVPKEALADAGVRAAVVPGLRVRSVCALLARYAPDAAAPDPLPPGLLDALQEEGEEEEEEEGEEEEEPLPPPPPARGGGVFGRLRRSTAGGGDSGRGARRKRATPPSPPTPSYAPPDEAALLAAGLVDPVALDQDAASDGELEGLAAGAGAGGVRFALLRALWASAR